MIDSHCLPIFFLGATIVGGAVFALWWTARSGLRRRTIDDIADFLVDPDITKLHDSFDPAQDDLWRTAGNNRRMQRVRMELLSDCLALMAKNARVLFQWADTEEFDNRHHNLNYDLELLGAIKELKRVSNQFNRMVLATRVRLLAYALCRFEDHSLMPVPQLAQFQRVFGADLMEIYRAVAEAAENLALWHGDVAVITAKIRLCFWTTT